MEIDLTALNEQMREMMFVECKWQKKKTGMDVLENLMAKKVYSLRGRRPRYL